MKILCIGDPHFKTNNTTDTDLLAQKTLEAIDAIKPNFTVVLGDILDRHETIHVSPLERAIRFLKSISEKCLLVVLIGNHDMINNSSFLTENHPFTALKYWQNTIVAHTVIDTYIEGKRFVFCPYVYPGRLFDALTYSTTLKDYDKKEFIIKKDDVEEWDNDKIMSHFMDVSAFFCHQEFRGAKMGAITSDIGDIWKLSYQFVMSGHIHNFDQLQPNLIYSGTAYYTNYGESGMKSFSLLHIEGKEIIHERINTNMPKKKIIYLDASEVNSYKIDTTDQVKVIIEGLFSEIRSVLKSEKIKKWKENGVVVCVKEKIEENKEKKEEKKEIKNFHSLLNEKINNTKNEFIISLFREIK